jgi:hypothetical protein
MQFPAHLLVLLLAAIAAAIAAVPTLGQTDTPQPPCAGVPNDFWFCISDCLYKICPGDDACYKTCDANCSKLSSQLKPTWQSLTMWFSRPEEKFVPDCEPGIH